MLSLVTLLFIAIGVGLSLVVGGRRGGAVGAVLAYFAGFLGVIVATAVAFFGWVYTEAYGVGWVVEYGILCALFAPAAGLVYGYLERKRAQHAATLSK